MKVSDYSLAEGVTATIFLGRRGGPYSKVDVPEVYLAPIDNRCDEDWGNNGYADKIATDYVFKYKNKSRRIYESRFSTPSTYFCTVDGLTQLIKIKGN
jgi:hypothetical protein